MYKRHKIMTVVLFALTSFLAFVLKADYHSIAEEAIAVVAIALAVYISAASVLLGSPFADRMKKQRDNQIPTKTNLGVLAAYLRTAGFFSLLTIIASSVYVLKLDFQSVVAALGETGKIEEMMGCWLRVIAAISCGMFAVNIFFIWLILLFLINSLTKSV